MTPHPITDAQRQDDQPRRLLYWRDPDDAEAWGPPEVGYWLNGAFIVADVAMQDPDGWLPLPDVG